MPKIGRPRAIERDPALLNKLADCFLVGFTDEQTALYCGISHDTIGRIRAGKHAYGFTKGFSVSVKIAELEREMRYRKKIWGAKGFWQGAAWFLERKYPTQFSRPELQLQINNQIGPANIVILSPEQSSAIASRLDSIRAKYRPMLENKVIEIEAKQLTT